MTKSEKELFEKWKPYILVLEKLSQTKDEDLNIGELGIGPGFCKIKDPKLIKTALRFLFSDLSVDLKLNRKYSEFNVIFEGVEEFSPRQKISSFIKKISNITPKEDIFESLKTIFRRTKYFLNKHFKRVDNLIPSAPNTSSFLSINKGNCDLIDSLHIHYSQNMSISLLLSLHIGSNMLDIDDYIFFRDKFTEFLENFLKKNGCDTKYRIFDSMGEAYYTIAIRGV